MRPFKVWDKRIKRFIDDDQLMTRISAPININNNLWVIIPNEELIICPSLACPIPGTKNQYAGDIYQVKTGDEYGFIKRVKVIGNIFENPGLMEKSNEAI